MLNKPSDSSLQRGECPLARARPAVHGRSELDCKPPTPRQRVLLGPPKPREVAMKFRRSAHSGTTSFLCARVIVSFVAVLAPTVAPATDETFEAMLNAAQVVAGGGSTSTATGFATFVFDTSARSITTDLSWVGLTGPTDRGHIHDGSPGALSSDIFFHDVVINGLTGT